MQIDVKYNNTFPHKIVKILFILVQLSNIKYWFIDVHYFFNFTF
jgi:hypothetical protein